MTNAATQAVPVVKLRHRREVADHTVAFELDKPAGWTFKAGQFVDLTLISPPETDGLGNVRTFTLASAPHEGLLMVVTRMRETAFKNVLGSMPLGAELQLDGPYGELVLHDDPSRPAVLVAGGIGITPFRSMVVDAAKQKLPHRIFLFYSNHRPEDAAFLDELAAIEKVNPHYNFVPTMTRLEKSHHAWHGETGHIDEQMLARHLNGVEAPKFYIAGPPGMVKGVRGAISRAGFDRSDIFTEEFSGY
jgi:ferredoxin-NADP reductase